MIFRLTAPLLLLLILGLRAVKLTGMCPDTLAVPFLKESLGNLIGTGLFAPARIKRLILLKTLLMRFAHFSLHLIFISAVTKHRSRSGKNALAVKRGLRITTLRTRKICRAGLIMKFLRLSSQRARGLSVGTRF